MKTTYIARLRADAAALVKMMAAAGKKLPVNNFNSYCSRKGCTLPGTEENLTLHRVVRVAAKGGVSTLDAVTAFRLHPKLRSEVQKLLAETIPPELIPGLIRVVAKRLRFPEIKRIIAPEFVGVGLPFALVAEDIKKVMWDHTAGVAGVWRRIQPGKFMMGLGKTAAEIEEETGSWGGFVVRVTAIKRPFLISVFPFTNGQALAIPGGKKLCQSAPFNHESVFRCSGEVKVLSPYFIRTSYFGVGENLDDPIQSNLGLPLVGMLQSTAKAFAVLDGARLPSDLEWEYAARYDGPRDKQGVRLGYLYPCGPSLVNPAGRLLAHVHREGIKGTAPVGSYPREMGSGLYDMAGNVQEWVKDRPGAKGGMWTRGIDDGGEKMARTCHFEPSYDGRSAYQGLRLALGLENR